MIDERISVAPMMEWTDSHYRMLMRSLTTKTVLYSEMVVDETVLYAPKGSLDFFIGKHIREEPSVIQLGGHDPETLANAAEACQQYSAGYSEINLNCGCPSQRVAKRCFGAKLMLEPDHVRQIVSTMQRRVSIPITVKCRIGADDLDSYDNLKHFISSANAGGVKKFIVHARKCFLSGLTTKQNRDIPPLRYDVVHRLVRDFPELTFVLNGGIQTLEEARRHTSYGTHDSNSGAGGYQFEDETLPPVHGVMIGRTAYSNPLQFATADSTFHGIRDPGFTRREVIDQYIDYCEWVQSELGPRREITNRPERGVQLVSSSVLINSMRNVICGIPHTARFRMALNDIYMDILKAGCGNPNPSPRDVIEGALGCLNDSDLDAPLGNVHGPFDDDVRTMTTTGTTTALAAGALSSATPESTTIRTDGETSHVIAAAAESVFFAATDTTDSSSIPSDSSAAPRTTSI